MIKLTSPVTNISGVGEAYQKKLKKLDILTIKDLINHFPFRYIDYQNTTPIGKIKPDQSVCLKARIVSVKSHSTKGRLTIQKVQLKDSSGPIQAVFFNQPYLRQTLKTNHTYFFTGKTKIYHGRLILNSPQFEPIKRDQLHSQRLLPVYPQTQGVSSKWLRHKLHLVLKNTNLTVNDTLNSKQLQENNLITLQSAYQKIHFPSNKSDINKAQKRFAFDDLLSIYLQSESEKQKQLNTKGTPIPTDIKLQQNLLESLPFKLTQGQNQAIKQIFPLLSKDHPTRTLLQGDVGSGKTIIALAAALQALNNNQQAIVMAPTQILAEQHFHTFKEILKPFAFKPHLVTGTTTTNQSHNLLIGTHALLHRSKLIKPNKLSLIIVDEQHRFGVLQKNKYLDQTPTPHLITISATPIPRSLALTIYGHINIATLKQLPSHRKTIKTWLIDQKKRPSALKWLSKQIKTNNTQAFYVCPLINPSTKKGFKGVKADTTKYQKLKKGVLKNLRIQLLHGSLSPQEKNQRISDFQEQKIDLLVTTPVIEVGIDIKNAAIIVIENAERFGLAQLHQLRGRVGRNNRQAYCILISSDIEENQRLKHLTQSTDGFHLAEIDLKLRGRGELFGTSQAGHYNTQFSQFWRQSLKERAQKLARHITTS